MTWYIMLIGVLGMFLAASVAIIAYLVNKINDLRAENISLKIDDLHK